MREELSELIAGARAVLEDAAARGVWAEDPAAAVPLPAPMPVPMPVPVRETSAPGLAQWSILAETARVQAPAPSVALDRVRADLGDCRRCALCKDRRTIVFGAGDPDADLAVIGEAPGYHEDQQGEPFVGPAGQMLDRMLENVLGLTRAQVYITNVVKCRPPKNRNPHPDEVDACRPFLEAQLRAVRPKLVLLLGSVAYKTLFATDQGVTRHRGTWKSYPLGDAGEPDRAIPVLPTFHPAYLLRTPADKKLAFEDLKLLRTRYDELGGKR